MISTTRRSFIAAVSGAIGLWFGWLWGSDPCRKLNCRIKALPDNPPVKVPVRYIPKPRFHLTRISQYDVPHLSNEFRRNIEMSISPDVAMPRIHGMPIIGRPYSDAFPLGLPETIFETR